MPNVWIPGASAAQRFDGRFPASLQNPTKGVLHSTETGTWPGYQGGANAPNATLLWDGRTLNVRDHFPLNMSGRALFNSPGGVDTNTAGVAQFEIVGTCDRPTAQRYGYLYLPEAPPAFYAALAAFMRTVESLTGIPRATTTRPWLPYPQSYGNSAARMGYAEWNAFRGWCGHQHVPENDHGDPGNLDIARLLNLGDNDMDANQANQLAQLHDALLTPLSAAFITDPGGNRLGVVQLAAWAGQQALINRNGLAGVDAKMDRQGEALRDLSRRVDLLLAALNPTKV